VKEQTMANLNRVQLIGRLGKDPETRYTPKGSKVCQFSVAVDDRWRSADGDTKERTNWFNVEAWGRLGEICQEYLGKGRLVYIEGRLRTDTYEKDGEKRYITKVVASTMQMLDRKPEEEEPVPPQPEEDEFPFD
jgi:single-strand DNA-binding protein